MPGQIILVSGTSGSGKSTTCDLLASRSEDFYLKLGIDLFLSASIFPAKFSHHGPRSQEGVHAGPVDESDPDGALRWTFGDKGLQAFHAMHEWVAAAAREGCNIIVDHLLMMDPPLLQDCIWRWRELPVLYVVLKPTYDVLMERVATRTMDKKVPAVEMFGDEGIRRAVEKLNRLRPWFYEAVYANDCSDLEIDTVKHNPEEVCALIEQRLREGPGTAFEALRRRYPKPFQ